ncbi:MAG: DUF4406 domain-containing protein [Burkholderiales bacterium]|nr:DUF4406 domain-containing protein [Burkholderiales bacterium]
MKPMMILVAGPYRSGTGDDPAKIAANLHRLETAALAVYERGHVPMIGEWVALPLAKCAGSTEVGDPISERFLYPTAARLIEHCDAILRLTGASKGADEDVRLAHARGIPVYASADEVPVWS